MGGVLGDVRVWAAGLGEVHERFVHRFARSEPRESALAYMRGLIAPLERKNGWTLAEEAGHGSPDRMHRLLNRCDWDADEVLDDVRDYVVEQLGDPGAVLIVDDTGFLKKGVRSAGVQRQYSGTAGRTENCQVGVFLAYAGERGRTSSSPRRRSRRPSWSWAAPRAGRRCRCRSATPAGPPPRCAPPWRPPRPRRSARCRRSRAPPCSRRAGSRWRTGVSRRSARWTSTCGAARSPH
ncbi:transposase [Streptomyces cyaneofuscatus]|nr:MULTISPECIES: transposase [Streptomyces]